MRVLHVTHELPPYETAGVAVYSYNLGRAQAASEEVFYFARRQDPNAPEYRETDELRDGVAIRFVNRDENPWIPFEATWTDPKMAGIFRCHLEVLRPEVVHFHHVLGLGIELFDVPRDLGIPTVITLHDFWPMCPKGQRMCYTDRSLCDPIDFGKCGPCAYGENWPQVKSRVMPEPVPPGLLNALRHHYATRLQETPGRVARRPRAMYRALMRTLAGLRGSRHEAAPDPRSPFERRFEAFRDRIAAADAVVAPSRFLLDQYTTHFRLPEGKVRFSAYGMDFSYAKPLPKTPSSRLRFGFVGSIIVTKGVEVALEGFLDAARSCPDIELHVHGAPNRWSGDYLDALKAMAAADPAGDRVFFHGRFDNARIGEVHAGIDILIVPSIWFENAPLALNEAAMTGTGVLTSDRGGMLEFVRTNDYGRTFELGNPRSLAAVIRDVVHDPDKRRALVGRRPAIKPVSVDAAEFLALYRDLIAARSR